MVVPLPGTDLAHRTCASAGRSGQRGGPLRARPARAAGRGAVNEAGLLPCVHCGFCLPACPTYTRLGDENDSPRGRLHLMRAVTEGRLDPAADAFQMHIDRCLGCRACEAVCPSGVAYGALLEEARIVAVRARRRPLGQRLLLRVFRSPVLTEWFMGLGRMLRASGLARLGARVLPAARRLHGARLGLAMLAASSEARVDRWPAGARDLDEHDPHWTPPARRRRVAVLIGCVQAGLFERVNDATARTLAANGYEVVPVPDQMCCGALHAHAGERDVARAMARRNIDAFEAAGVDAIAVNAAGCGAQLRDYGHLLDDDPVWRHRARHIASIARDVTELLAEVGPRPGAPVPETVTYDAPCHLLHAQGVDEAPRRVLAAVPQLRVVALEGEHECCGGAGIYGLTHAELGEAIGRDKVDAVLRTGARAVVTGNPGCIMQIGAGLLMRGESPRAVHPVEVLDESYRRAGYYDARVEDGSLWPAGVVRAPTAKGAPRRAAGGGSGE
ncbi:MAG: 4Fe-4S dicluster domain-containing protein [Gemmatimonadetes bacterium]|nr:MAG: 4Fe-4S dicluster domain-containing protein [Gemmatimonadota bacterium]